MDNDWLDDFMKNNRGALASVRIPVPTAPTQHASRSSSYADGCVNMLLARNGWAEPGPDFDIFAELSMVRMASDILRMGGATPDESPMKTVTRALGTSDFSNILANTMNKAVTLGYDAAPETWQVWTRQTETKDFRMFTRANASELPTPTLVQEGAEIPFAALGADSAETGNVKSYAVNISISREALINDDLDRVLVTAEGAGRAASRLVGDLAYSVLTTNAALSDGVALFHATHANLGTAGAPSITTLDELRGLMAAQTGPAGENLNVSPAILLGPRSIESTLSVLRAASTDPVDPDPLAGSNFKPGSLAVVTDGRLTGTAWYAVANPRHFSAVDVITLAGRGKRPQFEEISKPMSRDGTVYRLTHDVCAVAVDFRCLAKNAGA